MGGIWHSPVLIKISADKRPLNQLTVKNLFFSLIIKTFAINTIILFMKKTTNLSVWMKEICTQLVKLHIIFSRMQRVNQHDRPSIIQVGCPTCCYQVCALDHTNVGTADLDYSSGPCHRNDVYSHRCILLLYVYFMYMASWQKKNKIIKNKSINNDIIASHVRCGGQHDQEHLTCPEKSRHQRRSEDI